MKEYGSNVQKLADHIVTMDDRAQRTLYAHILIELMRQIHPNMRDNQDYTNKLWDDLYIISGFELDVDSPYPPPSKELLGKRPLKVEYNQHHLAYRHYGRNIDLLLEKAVQTEDEEDRLAFVSYIFRLMRSFFNTWNKDNPEDNILLGQLELLSKGKLKAEIDKIRESGPVEAAPKDRNNNNYERSRGNQNNHRNQGQSSVHQNRSRSNSKFGGKNNNRNRKKPSL